MINSLMRYSIGIIALTLVFSLASQRVSAQALSAQLSDKEIPVSEFNSINVANDFEVTLSRGAYGVRLTVDKELAPYVEVYVKAKTLYLSFNEKSVPKEVKKLYKGKGGLTPVFRVVAYSPEIRSITLSDNATFIGIEEFTAPEFELNAAGKSQVKNLSVSTSSAKIALRKNAQAVVQLRTDRGVEASTENSSNLKLSFTGNELALNTDGSSVVVVDGPCQMVNVFSSGSSQVTLTSDTSKVDLTTEGSSKLVLSGKADVMTVKGSRSSSVDAYSMPVRDLDVNLSGSSSVTSSVSALVNATLVGGSSLYYSGTPEFKLGKIVKSTLAPYGTK